MTLVTTVHTGPDWPTVNLLADAYLAGKLFTSISPFIQTDGNVGVLIVTTV